MKQIVLICFIIPLFSYSQVQKEEYNGKVGVHLIIQNPYSSNKIFCMDSVFINGHKYNGDINVSVFQIVYDSVHIAMGDSANIVLYHKYHCMPHILYSQDSSSKKTEFISQDITSDGVLKWTTKNEKYKLPFIIEQYK